ncbi:24816_t:CDS:2, partial [Dentiscutata erythropus]
MSSFLEFIPHYVLVCLPAIAIIGAAPFSGLKMKIFWMLHCLGCPFTGLIYYCNVENNETALCTYWLTSDHYVINIEKSENEKNEEDPLESQPTINQINAMNQCIAEPSIQERIAPLGLAIPIVIGIYTAIARAIGPCTNKDWAYFPVAFAWTLPAILRIVFGRKIVFKDPIQILGKDKIRVRKYSRTELDYKNNKTAHAIITAFASVTLHWIVVILAYFTPPIGFGEKSVSGNKYIH